MCRDSSAEAMQDSNEYAGGDGCSQSFARFPRSKEWNVCSLMMCCARVGGILRWKTLGHSCLT